MGRIPLLLTWIVLTGWAAARQQAPALPAELSDSAFWQLIVDTSEPDGYLASSESFDHIRAMQRRNLIVPVVGDFAGPKALRALGAYVRARGGTVNVFYASNVEANLFRAGTWKAFYENVGTMPVHDAGVLVRTFFGATAAGVQWAAPHHQNAGARIDDGAAGGPSQGRARQPVRPRRHEQVS